MPEIYIDDLIIEKFDAVLEDILEHRHTHYTFPGGRGGTKSSFIGTVKPLLLTQNPNIHAVAFRRYANTLRDSVFAQVNAGISNLGIGHLFKATVSPMEITYKPTGQKIMFRGLDEPEKIKSIKPPFGYIGMTWFEELDQYPGREALRKVLQSTMRGGPVFWNFESFNPPITAANWANRDILIERPDRLVTWSNYLDAPREWLGEQFIEEAEFLKSVNERAYRHEYLGEAVGNGGQVFDNVVDELIDEADIRRYDRVLNGVDWGYYPDPWAFVRACYRPSERALYIFDEQVHHKKGNRETATIVKKLITPGETVTCDSAEPKSVGDYRDEGIIARGAEKGPGSIDYSMKWLQSLKRIVIDPRRCPKTYKEFIKYEYERNKEGEILSGYVDKDNHCIDAVRYATEQYWKRRRY